MDRNNVNFPTNYTMGPTFNGVNANQHYHALNQAPFPPNQLALQPNANFSNPFFYHPTMSCPLTRPLCYPTPSATPSPSSSILSDNSPIAQSLRMPGSLQREVDAMKTEMISIRNDLSRVHEKLDRVLAMYENEPNTGSQCYQRQLV